MMTGAEPSVLAVTAADAGYALPLAVTLRSAGEHLRPGYRLEARVFDDGIGPALRKRIERSLPQRVEVEWMDPPPGAVEGLPVWGRMPATTYLKLLVPRVLPDSVGRALWLDADLLVTADLAELWEKDLEGSSALAAMDPVVPRLSSQLGVRGWSELGLSGEAPYFNAGVMLMDVGRWRADDVATRALEYLDRFADTVFFHDQEALNVVLVGRWGALEDRWNRSVSGARLGRVTETIENSILHYSGTLKPWLHPSRAAWHAVYYEYVDRTEWRGWRPRPSLRATLLDLYQASPLRGLLHPLEQRWFRRHVERTRRLWGTGTAQGSAPRP